MRKFLILLMFLAMVLAINPVVICDEEETDTEEPTKVFLPEFTIELGGASHEVSGNSRRQRQYVTLTDDFYVGLLDFNFRSPEGHPLMHLAVRDLGTSSVNGNIRFWLNDRRDLFRGQMRRSTFFRDWSGTGESLTRNDQKYDFRMPLSSGEIQLEYSQMSLGGMENTNPENWNMKTAEIQFLDDFSDWQTQLGYQYKSFSFKENDNFDGKTNIVNLHTSKTFNERTSIAADAAFAKTSLSGHPGNPGSYNLSVEGIHEVGDDVTLSGALLHRKVNNAITQNAYASGNTCAKIRADFDTLENTRFSVGGSLNQVDYVNGAQTQTIDANNNNLFAKISSRLTKNLKFKAGISQTSTEDRPSAIDITGLPTGALMWSSKKDYNVELSYTSNWQSGLTGRWRSRSWSNSDYLTDNSIIGTDLFGWWMPNDEMTLYASYLDQNFDLDGFINSDSFVADSNTYVFGVTFQPRPEWMLDLSLADSESSGGVGVDQEVFTLGLSYSWPTGEQISFRGAFDRFTTSEQATFLDYDSDWFEIKLSKSF